jgi:hypothetical protein
MGHTSSEFFCSSHSYQDFSPPSWPLAFTATMGCLNGGQWALTQSCMHQLCSLLSLDGVTGFYPIDDSNH